MRQEDIDKISATYENYEELRRYSRVVELDEIKENDYNLNIPRYVDTFEEEEPVDLTEVSEALKAIDKEMKTTDTTIADFCNQLGFEVKMYGRIYPDIIIRDYFLLPIPDNLLLTLFELVYC